jgi:hypothetical protein
VPPPLDPLPPPAVLAPLAPHPSQRVVRPMVAAGAAVPVAPRAHPVCEPSLASRMPGVLRAAARAAPVGDRAAIRLVERLQQHRHGRGPDRGLQGRQPSRSPRAGACGAQSAHHRWRTVRCVAAFLVSCRQGGCQGGLVRLPWDPVPPRGTRRGAAPTRPGPQRHLQGMGARGARPGGRRLGRRSAPFPAQRDGRRARRPWPLSCLGAAMTPGCACAAPGPPDGRGALAARPRGLPRARLSRRARPGGVRGCVGCGSRCCQRSSAPRRRPHAPPACLRVPACPSVPVVPALCGGDRPGGAAGLAWGSCERAVDAPRRVRRRTAPRLLRPEADAARTRSRVLPCSACSGLRPRWLLPCRAESDGAETAFPRREPVRGSHPEAPASWRGYPLRDHDFHTTFAARYRPC